jgi:transcriptional regulator with XRE-family HTH domain
MTRNELGKAARSLREAIGWTQSEVANVLGLSVVHVCNMENGKAAFSESTLDTYQKVIGVDLYVLAWCQQGDLESLPVGIRNAAEKLSDALSAEIRKTVNRWKNS